ncbi:related to dynactin subunit p62 [Sporisorium scitamineum]|uniref:Dynactin subunit 4 n=1 Tax=Sporisorium scitamineum TaxID=49012 RepID=A0A140KLW6_9BASI|nr:related to dynactin subunit p62 [Sporisorium scitamineum]
MAAPHVLYYCPCNQAHLHANAASTSTHRATSSLGSPPPGLPAYSPASRYAFHPLDTLYFCDECDQIRCNRCVTVDISSYYCPNCLFEVPGASVKAEKNRCARNCFECPCCQHTLSVVASDLNSQSARSLDPTDPAASQGEPPYYLACSFCRWDSKSIGLVFEKPTGLSLQLQRSEDGAPDVHEFERLKDHFDPYLKAQTQAAITSAAVGSGSSSCSRSLPTSTSSAALASSSNTSTSSRSARATAARNAATAALQSSKLVRDLPHLANSKHLAPGGLASSARSGPIEPDELKQYRALNPWQPPTDTRSSSAGHASLTMGVVAKREKHRRDYLARLQSTPNQPFASLDAKISSLEQRWSSVSIADQPIRAAELRPTRVALKSKVSKRCPACRHIVIKPDIKATSNRFKIKLVATNFLPEIQIRLADQQPYLDPLHFRSMGTAGSTLMGMGTGSATNTLRRRPQSVRVSATDSPNSVSSQDVDVNRLAAGQTYSFEIAVSNPLDDPVQVELGFVRFADPSASRAITRKASLGSLPAGAQAFPEPKHIFSSKSTADTSSALFGPSSANTQPPTTTKKPRVGWQIYPSATSIPLNAFNEVWELEDAEDLYLSKPESDAHPQSSSDIAQHRHAVRTAFVSSTDRAGATNESTWVIQEQDNDEDDDEDLVESDDADLEEEEGEDEQGGELGTDEKERSSMRRDPTSTSAPQRERRTALRKLAQGRPLDFRLNFSSSNTVQHKPFVQKGHTTTFYLDLAVSAKDPPKPGPLELAMHVTYRYMGTAAQSGEQGSGAAARDFSFWTSIRLGTIVASDEQ